MTNTIYCVYETTYLGNIFPKKFANSKLTPTKYIGSSSIDKIDKGYRGSVSSKSFEKLWKQELKENPELFEIKILETFETREEALAKELEIQQTLNVVKDEKYFNMSLANKNGFFGRDVSGKNNPRYGKTKENNESTRIAAEKISISAKKRANDPNYVNPTKGKPSKNKGLTKENNQGIKKQSIAIKEFYSSEEGKKSLAKGFETRKRLDELDPSRVERRKLKLLQKRKNKKGDNE
jgi:hypothetical protein